MLGQFLTGQVADLLGITEPRLNDYIRRRKINPAPPIISGRRMWSVAHIILVADLLGFPRDVLQAKLAEVESFYSTIATGNTGTAQ